MGVYDALNKGVEKSSGDIIGFLHSDDIFHEKNILNQIINKFEVDKLDGVYGDLQYIDQYQQSI